MSYAEKHSLGNYLHGMALTGSDEAHSLGTALCDLEFEAALANRLGARDSRTVVVPRRRTFRLLDDGDRRLCQKEGIASTLAPCGILTACSIAEMGDL
jgi:hypothetical protein